MPEGTCARVDTRPWEPPALFRLMAEIGEVEAEEMYRVFNMGVGMILAVAPDADAAVLRDLGALPIGEVVAGDKRVDVVLRS